MSNTISIYANSHREAQVRRIYIRKYRLTVFLFRAGRQRQRTRFTICAGSLSDLSACVAFDEAAGIRFKNKDGINCFWIPISAAISTAISAAIKNALRFSFPAWGMFKTLHTGRRQDTARIFTKLKARSARKEHLAFCGAADLQCILYSCAPPPAGRTKMRPKRRTGCRNLSIPGCAAYAAAWESMGKLMTASQNSFPQALKAYAPHKAVLCGKCLSKTPFQGIIFRE